MQLFINIVFKKVCVIIVTTRVRGIFPESPLNTDTRIMDTMAFSLGV